MLLKGAMNGEAFLGYIDQCLAHALRPRDIVVDNVPFDKVAGWKSQSRPPEQNCDTCWSTRQTSTQSIIVPSREGVATQSGAAHIQRLGAIRSLLHSRT
jgi:hypothetical protein